ncbi:MAG: histone deacetylase family protein [Solirubrobacteraceae bacterium]
MSAALYFSHESSLAHDPARIAPGHPDTPARLHALEAALAGRDWLGWERRSSPAASVAQLELAHAPEHVAAIRRLSEAGGGMVDPDTYVMEASWEAALHAAGGACELARSLLAGEAQVGFGAHRPSGHHAERDRAMGFCLFNNVAVAAAWAIAELGLGRVLVIDWDVHHGNGTAEIFRQRSDVLFASLHQSPLYPGTGPLGDAGSGAGKGYTINLPVPPGTGEALWMDLFERVALAAAREYRPELILVSAGFDAHEEDPLASCRLRTSSFPSMAAQLRELALELGVPLGVVLEGGYNTAVLAECVCAMLPALTGELPQAPPRERAAREDPLVEAALRQHRSWWPLP